jgi:ligand-binding sensor domain-containing protein
MKSNFYRILTVIFLSSVCLGAWAQGKFTWTNLGPDNLGNITRTLAIDGQGNLLAGSQGGGLWISANQGVSWNRVTSYDQGGGNPNISSIAVDGNDIYVGTGGTSFRPAYLVSDLNGNPAYDFRDDPDGFVGNLRGLPGGGVYVSTDGGSTWAPANATNTADTRNYKGPFVSITKVFASGGRVFVGTEEGLYYSEDKLQTITKCQGSDAFQTTKITDVDVSANGTLFAGGNNRNSSIDDSLYVSTNDGVSFTSYSVPVFFSNGKFSFNGLRIAVAPSDPSVVYIATTSASQSLSGVYRSNDNGVTWERYAPPGSSQFSPLSNQGANAFVLEVFPDNENELILAGNNWWTYRQGTGWVQSAQHVNPTASDFISRAMYDVVFEDDNTLYVGTSTTIIRSTDRAETFSRKGKGYESSVIYSVSATGLSGAKGVLAGTPDNGVIFNGLYDSDLPSNQGYATVSGIDNSDIATSYLHPGALLIQGNDKGLLRSLNNGAAFEAFYGQPINPQVAGLVPANSDTIIDRPNANSGGGSLLNGGGPAQTPFIIDEVIPNSVLGNTSLTKEELREQSEEYAFFCSRNYVWVINGAFGDGLQVKWNRVSNQLVGGPEYFTALASSNDADHYVWVGSSQGGLWRLDGPHDLATYDATANVEAIHTLPQAGLLVNQGRWLTSIAVDPQDHDRVVVTYGGYGGNLAGAPGLVYMTETATTNPNFVQIIGSSAKEPIYTSKFVVDPNSGESVLLLGTESGLYSVDNFNNLGVVIQARWTSEFGNSYGKVPVYDIDVRNYVSEITNEETQDFVLTRDNTVFVATHGRGIWSSASLKFNREGNPGTPLPAALKAKLYPNPSQGLGYLNLELPEDGNLQYVITDISGRRIASQHENLRAGEHNLELDLSSLSPGVYLIELTAETKTAQLSRTLKWVLTR